VIDKQDADDLVLARIGSLYGDANLDGIVDGTDLSQWSVRRFEMGTGWATGDFNGDGVTDVRDYNVWNENKFQGTALTSSTSGSTPLRMPRAATTPPASLADGSIALDVAFGVRGSPFSKVRAPTSSGGFDNEPVGPVATAIEASPRSTDTMRIPTIDRVFTLVGSRDGLASHAGGQNEQTNDGVPADILAGK